ncbi:MAG: DUF58 domain-containing protein [Lachnospiraceae bacterium]|nr:DUF58 domain-containing protein [Lachnospiraceae bacterium]
MFLNWLLYLVIMGILTVSAAVFTERVFVVLLVFGLMVPVVSLFVVFLLRRRFVAVLHSDTEVCHSQDDFNFHVSITNHGHIPCGNISITVTKDDALFAESETIKKTTAIAGKSKTRCDMAMYVSHCGRLQLTLKSVRLYSPFGLFSTLAKIDNAVTVFDVYPDDVEMTVSPVRNNPFAYIAEEEYSTTRPGDDPSELFGVREYRPGDKQNRIHWNLTAARDELIVKELGLPVDTATILLFDCYELPRRGGEGEEIYDTLMMTLSAIAHNMIRNRRIFYLAWINESEGESINAWRNRIECEEDYLLALSQIFDVHPSPKNVSITGLYASRFAKERYRNILYVTTELTQSADEGLAQMRFDANVTVYEVTLDAGHGGATTRKDGVKLQRIRADHVREDINSDADY